MNGKSRTTSCSKPPTKPPNDLTNRIAFLEQTILLKYANDIFTLAVTEQLYQSLTVVLAGTPGIELVNLEPKPKTR